MKQLTKNIEIAKQLENQSERLKCMLIQEG